MRELRLRPRGPFPPPDGTSKVAVGPRVRWATACCCALGAALAGPEWLPHDWTREDGPVEWTGFALFLAGSALAALAAWRLRSAVWSSATAAALAAALLFAAGEEISWGQRILDVETPDVLIDGHGQDELNLHNLAGVQNKAVLGQLAVASGGVLLGLRGRRPWMQCGLPFFAGYLAYRVARGVFSLAEWGAAGRHSEAAEVLLSAGLLVIAAGLFADASSSHRSGGSPASG